MALIFPVQYSFTRGYFFVIITTLKGIKLLEIFLCLMLACQKLNL